jgi:hypothetical protein
MDAARLQIKPFRWTVSIQTSCNKRDSDFPWHQGFNSRNCRPNINLEKMRPALIIFALLCAGCQTTQPAAVNLAPLSDKIADMANANADLSLANERLNSANESLQKENTRLLSTLKADVDAGMHANSQGWLSLERAVWDHQLLLLPDAPDLATQAKWIEAAKLYSAGGESAMHGVVSELHSDAKAQASKIGELLSVAEQLEVELDAANEAASLAVEALQRQEEESSSLVEQARQSEREAVRHAQVEAANKGGVACGVLAIALLSAAVFSPAAKSHFMRGAALSASVSVSLFAAARWLGSPWFEWSIGGSWIVAGLAWIAWRIRDGLHTEPMQVAAPILVEELDKLYDDPENIAWMDSKLFPALQDRGPAYDAAVKRIKADNLVGNRIKADK